MGGILLWEETKTHQNFFEKWTDWIYDTKDREKKDNFKTYKAMFLEGITLDDPWSTRCLLLSHNNASCHSKKVNAAPQCHGSSMSDSMLEMKWISSVSLS